jgi:hypothetical protein
MAQHDNTTKVVVLSYFRVFASRFAGRQTKTRKFDKITTFCFFCPAGRQAKTKKVTKKFPGIFLTLFIYFIYKQKFMAL